MTPITIAALGIVTVTSLVLWLMGNRFTRRFVALTGAMPPLTWMFRRTQDEELERSRRAALAVLPVYLVALGLYLFQS
jgi:hypothetical protein